MATVTAQTSPFRRRRSPARRVITGSPIPTGAMIATRFMELRKRRTHDRPDPREYRHPHDLSHCPTVAHAFDPKSYGPAGGYSIYTGLVAGVMYVFGFIVAATLAARRDRWISPRGCSGIWW